MLLQTNQQLIVDVQAHIDIFTTQADSTGSNLTKLKSSLKSFIQDLSRQKRTPATHIFVIMISSYERKHKPYAIPIQCIPYTSMVHSTTRHVLNNIVQLMKERNMTVVGKFNLISLCNNADTSSLFAQWHKILLGFTSNGEYNAMRNRGYTRPLSVLQIRSDIRSKYARLSKRTMQRMLTPQGR